jgi:hypothetical protein
MGGGGSGRTVRGGRLQPLGEKTIGARPPNLDRI